LTGPTAFPPPPTPSPFLKGACRRNCPPSSVEGDPFGKTCSDFLFFFFFFPPPPPCLRRQRFYSSLPRSAKFPRLDCLSLFLFPLPFLQSKSASHHFPLALSGLLVPVRPVVFSPIPSQMVSQDCVPIPAPIFSPPPPPSPGLPLSFPFPRKLKRSFRVAILFSVSDAYPSGFCNQHTEYAPSPPRTLSRSRPVLPFSPSSPG